MNMKSVSNGNTDFSEVGSNDFIDEYEDDFMSDISSDDSFKDFLKSKAKSFKSIQKPNSSLLSEAAVPQTTFRNKFLTGFENDDLSFYSKEEPKNLVLQERIKYGKHSYDDFSPQVTSLEKNETSSSDKLVKTKSVVDSPILIDNAKPKKVEFQPKPIPRSRHFNMQSPQVNYETSNYSQHKLKQSKELFKEFGLQTSNLHSDFDKSIQHSLYSSSKPYSFREQSIEKDQNATQRYSSFEKSPKSVVFRESSNEFHKPKEGVYDNESNTFSGTAYSTVDKFSPYNVEKAAEPIKDSEHLQSSFLKSKNSSLKYSDYLIDQLKPYPSSTKKLDLSQQSKHSSLKSKSGLDSPRSSASEESSKKSLSIDHLQLKLDNIPTKTKQSSYTDFLSSLPSLDTSKSGAAGSETKKNVINLRKKSSAVKREKKSNKPLFHDQTLEDSAGVSGDDLLALFEQVAVTDKPEIPLAKDSSLVFEQKKQTAKHMKPSEALAHTIVKQQKASCLKQLSSSQQLIENVIESVAVQNQTYAFANQYNSAKVESPDDEMSKCVSTKKKFRRAKPPKNYKGLGSLQAFQQLQHLSKSTTDLDDVLSTNSLRSGAYMIWLANHEKKTKKKRKQKLLEEENENEKKQKEIEEKVMENASARKAWTQRKEEKMAEQELSKKTFRKKQREERIKVEEEKWKSMKRAEVARKRSLIEARKSHQIELKLKQEDKMIQEQKLKDRKQANKRALEKWNEERGKPWQLERKKNLREKKIKEKAKIEYHARKSKEAKQNFRKWQEKKNQQQCHQHGQITFHEDKPPWCPPSKNQPIIIQ